MEWPKAQDSVVGACSAELKEKIMRQIPYVSLRNSKQLAHKLKLAVEQRTEIAINVRTDDGLTNGASNVIRLIQLKIKVNHHLQHLQRNT